MTQQRDLPFLDLPFLDPPDESSAHAEGMANVTALASRVAATDTTLLITGESGVGKDHLARAIHAASRRAAGPYVAVNCGALPEALFESELFGHARGAFTGAQQDRPGLFEAAERGSLLLDEVSEVPLALQVKLLRALQEREVRRVGETRHRKVNVRILAATNRNLAHEVREGRFRQDLFYRLNVIELAIPPLRERPDELRRLVDTILMRTATRMQRLISGYTPDALVHLLRYSWPGNIRELENTIERACALATGAFIEESHLPDVVRQHPSLQVSPARVRALRDVEREYILAVLAQNHGNRTRTAQQLGIGAATLFRKLKDYEAKR